MNFVSKNPAYHHLKNKWTAQHRSLQSKLWDKHGEVLNKLAASSIGGMMLLSYPTLSLPGSHLLLSDQSLAEGIDKNVFLADKLKEKVPAEVRNLTLDEEKDITKTISDEFGFRVTAEINGIRLNRTYGMIGGEQHLYRFPGDNLYKHADTSSDWAMYSDAGIAPHLGAWGYFAPSENQFSTGDKLRERYYIAVPTFLTPGYAENTAKYGNFFKYRKMLVVNPVSGQAIISDIADAGPSEYTGKHLGGSPEVMQALGFAQGPRKGAVLYFFIEDGDKIPLGPIKIKTGES